MNSLRHLHLAINARINPNFKELSRGEAECFIKELLDITDMKPLGSLNWSDAVDLDFPGQSFVQMITTSHSSLHYFADTNEIYFDLYSCKEYIPDKVVKLLDEHFGLREWHGILYNRANGKVPRVQQLGNQEMEMKVKN